MDHVEKQRIIDTVIFGDLFFKYGNITLLIKSPDAKIKSMGSFIYNNTLSSVKKDGLVSENDLISQLIEIGELCKDYYNKLSLIQDKIRLVSKSLINFVFDSKRLAKSKKLLRKLENEYAEIVIRKNKLTEISAENYALMSQQRYIISQCVFEDNHKLWDTEEDFDNFNNGELINKLTYYLFSSSLIARSTIRLIARTNPWRQLWLCSNGNPFDREQCNWSTNQKELGYWSKTYDLVYDAYERPIHDIVEDDDLLDSWFMSQGEKIESRSKKESVENLCNSKPSKPGINEHFIVTGKDDAKKIYEANDRHSRNQISAQQKVLKQKGTIQDQDMPKSQLNIREKAMHMRNEKIRRK